MRDIRTPATAAKRYKIIILYEVVSFFDRQYNKELLRNNLTILLVYVSGYVYQKVSP